MGVHFMMYPHHRKEAQSMEYEEAKQKIVEGLTKKQKVKSKFYFNDLAKILDEKPRAAKKLINQMVTEGVLEYWSSGSTSLYGLKGTGKQAAAEHED
jgi:Mn-dependent DtxR family transcriptional regulator